MQNGLRVTVETLGCRLNAFEGDALKADFSRRGYRVVDSGDPADVIVINSCTVTGQADRKSRNALYRARRIGDLDEDSRPLVVATGCMATGQQATVSALPGVDYVVDNEHKAGIAAIVDAHLSGEISPPSAVPSGPFAYDQGEHTARARRFLKIQDGCDNRCSFCIIPFVRGRAISRPLAAILDEARQIIDDGFHEIVITGVNIGRYLHDGVNFATLIEKLLALPGQFRVRLSSLEPDHQIAPAIDLLTDERLCPHLHLCLQSGSDRVLLAMRRLYNLESFEQLIDNARHVRPDLNATTDILVGFPGETDADFAATCRAVERLGFTHCHTFRYAKRNGTRAARMENQVDDATKQRRSNTVRKLAATNRAAYLRRLLGNKQKLLVESVSNQIARGYGECFIPIQAPCADSSLVRGFIDVRISKLPLPGADALRAVPVEAIDNGSKAACAQTATVLPT
uniref:2-methylthioadenine synthetase n=1 Tax=uncultured Spirochaetales bacterium HF0500_06B09 TaxID=710994 RepID=E0XY89_9SPIR|nr:2-methylthioadenine synthetase [uncultured Spirochaetales bacterium HF0500_06B09]